jgi:hypothetical protein
MNLLYHETFSKHIDSITDEGFRSSPSQITTPIEEDGVYYPSKDAGYELRGEFFGILNYTLDNIRPEKFPSRSPSIWFYSIKPDTPPLEREVCLSCSATEIFQHTTEPLVAVPFDIAEKLFLGESQQTFTEQRQISRSSLETLAQTYWDNAQLLYNPEDVPRDKLYEIYVSEENLTGAVVEAVDEF